jgi:hypothetical protein
MRTLPLLACLGLISGTAMAASAPAVFRITCGTHLRVRLGQTLDTRHVHSGAPFLATLDRAVVEDGRVVIPGGTPFEGVVVESKRSGRFRGRAVLEVTLRSFRLNGRTYAVATVPDARVSGSHKGRNLVLIGGGAVTGAGIGAIAGGGAGALIGAGAGAAAGATAEFITGRKHVRLPVETVLVFRLRGPIELRRV